MSSFQISLSPDLGQFVENEVRSGHYSDPSKVVEEALTLLRDLPPWTDQSLREAINVGISQIEQSKVAPWDPEDLKSRIRNRNRPA